MLIFKYINLLLQLFTILLKILKVFNNFLFIYNKIRLFCNYMFRK